MVPSSTRAQSVNAVEQIKTAKPRTLTHGVPTTSECQSELGRRRRIAHVTSATTKPLDADDAACRLRVPCGPRDALYSAPTIQASTTTPQQAATPTTTSSWTCELVTFRR